MVVSAAGVLRSKFENKYVTSYFRVFCASGPSNSESP